MFPERSALCDTDREVYLEYLRTVNGANLLEYCGILAVDDRGGVVSGDRSFDRHLALQEGFRVGSTKGLLDASVGVVVAGLDSSIGVHHASTHSLSAVGTVSTCITGVSDNGVSGGVGGSNSSGPDGVVDVSVVDATGVACNCGGIGCDDGRTCDSRVRRLDVVCPTSATRDIAVSNGRDSAVCSVGGTLSDAVGVGDRNDVSGDAGVVKPGKWRRRNAGRGSRKRNDVVVCESSGGSGVSSEGGSRVGFSSYFDGCSSELKSQLKDSRAKRLVVENELATLVARKQVKREQLDDGKKLGAARFELEQHRVQLKLARLRAKRFGDGGTTEDAVASGGSSETSSFEERVVSSEVSDVVSPDSSVSVVDADAKKGDDVLRVLSSAGGSHGADGRVGSAGSEGQPGVNAWLAPRKAFVTDERNEKDPVFSAIEKRDRAYVAYVCKRGWNEGYDPATKLSDWELEILGGMSLKEIKNA